MKPPPTQHSRPASMIVALLSAVRSALAYARRRAFADRKFAICTVIACSLVAAVAAYHVLFPRIIVIGQDSMAAYLVATSEGSDDGGHDLYYNSSCDLTSAAAVATTTTTSTAAVDVRRLDVSDEELADVARTLSVGGEWMPEDCAALHHTAVLVCYRSDMAAELRAFLFHVHRFLQRQNRVHYRVYVIEQTAGATAFNRGKLFNAGYREVCERSAAGCFVFHDVDLLPENPANVYGCTSCPRHMSANTHAFQFFGGVVAMTRAQYRTVNGYSNVYYGSAGLEDVDMFQRVYAAGYRVCRFDTGVSRYAAMGQWPRKWNANETGLRLLHTGPQRYATDGVDTVAYKLLAYEEGPLYTRILVSV